MNPDLHPLSAPELRRKAELEGLVRRDLHTFIAVGSALLELRDDRLYRDTHGTFEAYCREVLRISKSRANQLIDASKVVNNLTSADVKPTNEKQVRPLTRLDPTEQDAAWSEAVATAPNGRVPADHVRAVVERRSAEDLTTRVVKPENRISTNGHAPPELKGPETHQASGISKVNGVLAPDPPDVAAARAAGRIAADVVPEVTEPPAPPPGPAPEAPAAEPTDEEWLAALPLSAVLSGHALRVFHRDALLYRRCEAARQSYQHAFRRAAAPLARAHPGVRSGEYEGRTSRWLRLQHPRDWHRCPAPADGGCAGSGACAFGPCPKCHGGGYLIF